MPKMEVEFEALQVKITTHDEVAYTKEALQKKPTITKEEVIHARYPDSAYQKEVYQKTMEILRNLQ
ncbi:hypothetical protein KI387_044653, partial [Taxus chinensis]